MAMAKPARALIFIPLLLLLFVIASVSGSYDRKHMRMVGAKSKVKDVETNKEVQELGKFSVEEFNRKQKEDGGKLRFSRVVEAQKQVVSGMMYYLTIEAMEKEQKRTFNSVVVIKPWVRSKELVDFAPSKKFWGL